METFSQSNRPRQKALEEAPNSARDAVLEAAKGKIFNRLSLEIGKLYQNVGLAPERVSEIGRLLLQAARPVQQLLKKFDEVQLSPDDCAQIDQQLSGISSLRELNVEVESCLSHFVCAPLDLYPDDKDARARMQLLGEVYKALDSDVMRRYTQERAGITLLFKRTQ